MLRWLLLGLLIFGLGTGFKNGWLQVDWRRLLEDAGLDLGDPEQPMHLHDNPLLRPPAPPAPPEG